MMIFLWVPLNYCSIFEKKNLLGFQLIVLKDSLILPCRIWLRVKFCHLLGGVCHNLRFPPWKEGDPVIRKTLKVKITSYSPVEKFQINTFCFPGALAFHFKYSEFQGNFFHQRVDFSAVCNIISVKKSFK